MTVTSSSSATDKDFGNAGFGSGSTMTNSAFDLVDNLDPWTISDFEILLNSKNVIVATNPGQFYYHQRATNTSGSSSSMQFTINWPCQFQTADRGRSADPRVCAARFRRAEHVARLDAAVVEHHVDEPNTDAACSKTTTAGPPGTGPSHRTTSPQGRRSG